MRKLKLLDVLIGLLLVVPIPLLAQVDTGPDVAEPGSIEEIAKATTEARKTRNRVEREARKRRREVETSLKQNRKDVEQRVRRVSEQLSSLR